MMSGGKYVSLVFLLMVGLACPVGGGTENAAATEVRVGENNFLEIEGKPVFVIGAYGLPKGMSLQDGKAMGFNLVHASAKLEAWDAANREGLYVWHSFDQNLDSASGNVEGKKAAVRKTVEAFARHPTLLFWESMDEPAWTDRAPEKARATPAGLAEGYRYLKSLDSRHPVYLNHAPRNTVETLRKYSAACDIVCADVYPIIPPGMRRMYAITPEGRHGDLPNQTPSCIGEFVDKMKKVALEKQPVFIVLQGFAWEALREKNPDRSLIRYPSYTESRFMAYDAVLHGANGLMVWGLSYVPSDHAFLKDLEKTLTELRELSPVFLSPNRLPQPILRYHERGSTIAAGIETLCKKNSDGVYLVAANTGIDPAAMDFTSLPPEFASAKELAVRGENRAVPIANGAFFDEFEGLGVHVYQAAGAR